MSIDIGLEVKSTENNNLHIPTIMKITQLDQEANQYWSVNHVQANVYALLTLITSVMSYALASSESPTYKPQQAMVGKNQNQS